MKRGSTCQTRAVGNWHTAANGQTISSQPLLDIKHDLSHHLSLSLQLQRPKKRQVPRGGLLGLIHLQSVKTSLLQRPTGAQLLKR